MMPIADEPTPSERLAEQQRQSALLRAILSFDAASAAQSWMAPSHANTLLRHYQGHVRVLAADVLSQAYPTLKALLGDEPWPHVAQAFWQQHPPTQGQLHLWGQTFASWVANRSEWTEWPFLADMARLDWARHESLLAKAVEFNAPTLELLGQAQAEHLLLRLKPSMRVINSPWPVMSLYLAHQTADTDTHWQTARQAMKDGHGQCVCIHAGKVTNLPEAWFGWMTALCDAPASNNPPALGTLLDQFGDSVDFTAWLTCAVQQGWIWRIDTLDTN